MRRTQAQLADAREAAFDAIKQGVIPGYYKTTRCVVCVRDGDFDLKPCVARSSHNFRCREHVSA